MEIYRGKVLHSGIAAGKIHILERGLHVEKKKAVADVEAEVNRYLSARETAEKELMCLKQQAEDVVGTENAAIFGAQAQLLSDSELSRGILDLIRSEKANAEYAVFTTARKYTDLFSAMGSDYFSARSADLLDVIQRLIRILKGAGTGRKLAEPSLITAMDLLPSDTLQLDRRLVLAFITLEGSPLSHAAILARGLDIPAVSGIPVREEWDGHPAIVDAESGTLYIDPDRETERRLLMRRTSLLENRSQYRAMIGQESVTTDGKPIRLCANIGTPSDIASALENDAEGVGLFRTEFLCLGRRTIPDEEEQFQSYKEACRLMGGRPIVIRTLDLGSDKQSELLNLPQEKNPALGFRGIRIGLTHPELFSCQLRAIYRATIYGNLSILFPMITSVREILQIKKLIRSVQDELTKRQIPWRSCPIGIMIETPASALLSEELAGEVDFFSIGTNDLTQYTLAMDRQNGSLDSFYDPYSEAVMKEIEITVRNGHKYGCLVGICGELAADTAITDRLLKMGVDSLSVSPHMILPVRKAIRESCTDPAPVS